MILELALLAVLAANAAGLALWATRTRPGNGPGGGRQRD
jgi:hypothetical protein